MLWPVDNQTVSFLQETRITLIVVKLLQLFDRLLGVRQSQRFFGRILQHPQRGDQVRRPRRRERAQGQHDLRTALQRRLPGTIEFEMQKLRVSN